MQRQVSRLRGLPVLVVGSGIGGLTAALALHRAGVPVQVCERKQQPMGRRTAVCLWESATTVFDRLGVGESVRLLGVPITRAEVYTSHGAPVGALDFHNASRGEVAEVLCVPRRNLLFLISSHLPASTLVYDANMTHYVERDESVTVYFTNRPPMECAAVVGADGLYSTVRQQLWGAERAGNVGPLLWRGMSRGVAVEPGTAVEYWGSGLRFGYMPIHHDQAAWYAVGSKPESANAASRVYNFEANKSRLLDAFAEFPIVVREMIDATPSNGVIPVPSTAVRRLEEWGRGHVTLLGDAAHPPTNNLRVGPTLAVEDAFVLAQSVAGLDGDVAQSLQIYERLRVSRSDEVVRASDVVGRVAQWNGPVGRWARARMLTPGTSRVNRLLRSLVFDPGDLLPMSG